MTHNHRLAAHVAATSRRRVVFGSSRWRAARNVAYLVVAFATGCTRSSDAALRAEIHTAARNVVVSGDTAGLPASCSPADAVEALASWFRAVASGDSRAIALGVSPRFDWISVAPFSASEHLFSGRRWADLRDYASRRAHARERIRIESITFTGWHSNALNFGPLYLERTADDLGATPVRGLAKGAYACGEGILALSIAPISGPESARPNDRR